MGKRKVYVIVLLIVSALVPQQVFAMHIMEGFLPPVWCIVWGILTIPFLIAGYRSIKKTVDEHPRTKLLLAMAGAFTFVLSALKLPSITGSCSHPTGIGFGAILFGPPTMAVLGLIVFYFKQCFLLMED
jgi:cobalt/nickel transport system permease protein